MADVEGQGREVPPNPYRDGGSQGLSRYHPLTIMQRLIFMGISGWVLIKYYNAYNVILKSPHIRHEWFKLGLGFAIGKQHN